MNDEKSQQGNATPEWIVNAIKTVVIALLVAASTGGIISWRDLGVLDAQFQELRADYITDAATLAAIAQQSHSNTLHRLEHGKTAAREIARIDANERRSHANEINIQRLQRAPDPRPDPFTGSDGERLRKRIERLEGLR
jgi:hypothetical protein